MDEPYRPQRLGIGQLLLRLVHFYREEALARAAELGYGDIRGPHLQHILANVGMKGLRLTELADRAQLSLSATSELAAELEGLGYLRREDDPTDGRAKLIAPTARGRRAFVEAQEHVRGIEHHWATLVGSGRFDEACRVLEDIHDQLRNQSKSRPTGQIAQSRTHRTIPNPR